MRNSLKAALAVVSAAPVAAFAALPDGVTSGITSTQTDGLTLIGAPRRLRHGAVAHRQGAEEVRRHGLIAPGPHKGPFPKGQRFSQMGAQYGQDCYADAAVAAAAQCAGAYPLLRVDGASHVVESCAVAGSPPSLQITSTIAESASSAVVSVPVSYASCDPLEHTTPI